MALQNHLVIFARLPRLGTGKKRLAADVGHVRALQFQKNMLNSLLRGVANDSRWRTYVAITPNADGFQAPSCVTMLKQPKGNLGQRMAGVAKEMSPGPVLIVGSDIPYIQTKDIKQAFYLLRDHDAVLGPAGDGGYWAVGLQRRPKFLNPFFAVRWSTSHALADTVQNLKSHKVAYLRRLDDVDTGKDLQRLLKKE